MSHGEIVTFPTENYLGDGEGVMFGDPALLKQGLIVIHEWWGVNEQIEQEAEMISLQGNFCCLVPDIYRGKTATDHDTAGQLMIDLDWIGAVEDVQGAARYLLSRGCNKIGVTGFSMGGAIAFLAALKVPEISAAAPFYGIPSVEHGDLTRIKIPVQGHFGKKDRSAGFSTPTQYIVLREKLRACGVKFELNEYNCGHAFTNTTVSTYDQDATRLALNRMYEFMHKHLK